jgi:hypothetical protein
MFWMRLGLMDHVANAHSAKKFGFASSPTRLNFNLLSSVLSGLFYDRREGKITGADRSALVRTAQAGLHATRISRTT